MSLVLSAEDRNGEYTIEINNYDETMSELIQAVKQLLAAMGFHHELIEDYIPGDDEADFTSETRYVFPASYTNAVSTVSIPSALERFEAKNTGHPCACIPVGEENKDG